MNSRMGRLILLAVAIGAITAAHHLTDLHATYLHNIYQRLYYLPIFAAAYWFGIRGALAVSIVSAASYLPHIRTDWREHPEYRQAQYAELAMFQAVALVVGTWAEAEKRQRDRQERMARELAEAYRKLQQSFEHLQRAERLSALGQLSAGLAHEIKNPLASMKGSLEILALDFAPGHGKREFLEILEKEVDRLNGVLNEFLQFARPPRPDPQPCRIPELLESIRVLCSKDASRRGVHIDVACPEGFPELQLDAGQIQQALLNIVLNGIQAMPSGGRLAIEARFTEEQAVVEIRDQGPGIPPQNRHRIFDPFFTTKEGGTGLGMSIALQLVSGHGGEIRLIEQSGLGTTFQVILPRRSRRDV